MKLQHCLFYTLLYKKKEKPAWPEFRTFFRQKDLSRTITGL